MVYQLFGQSDDRTVAEVAAYWRDRGYRAETKYRRGIYYLKLWQEPPAVSKQNPERFALG